MRFSRTLRTDIFLYTEKLFCHGCIFCTKIDLVLWALEFPWMLCTLRCLAPPQCWQGSWTWRIFKYDDPHNVEITKHIHFLHPIPGMLLAKMEILREFLESSTIHGLSYISSSKVKPIELFNTVLMMSTNTVFIICNKHEMLMISFRPGQQKYFGLALSVSVLSLLKS